MITTRPSVEAPWILILFFSAYFMAVYLIGIYVMKFLQFQSKSRLVAAIIASSLTTLQILLTFKALRPLEVLLMVAVISLGAWYFSQAKS